MTDETEAASRAETVRSVLDALRSAGLENSAPGGDWPAGVLMHMVRTGRPAGPAGERKMAGDARRGDGDGHAGEYAGAGHVASVVAPPVTPEHTGVQPPGQQVNSRAPSVVRRPVEMAATGIIATRRYPLPRAAGREREAQTVVINMPERGIVVLDNPASMQSLAHQLLPYIRSALRGQSSLS